MNFMNRFSFKGKFIVFFIIVGCAAGLVVLVSSLSIYKIYKTNRSNLLAIESSCKTSVEVDGDLSSGNRAEMRQFVSDSLREFDFLVKRAYINILISVMVAMVMVLGAFYMLYLQTVFPLRKVRDVLSKMGKGDFLVKIEDIAQQDEIGDIVHSIHDTIRSIDRILIDIAGKIKELLPGVQTMDAEAYRLDIISKEEYSQAQQIATAAEEMSQTIGEIARNASSAAENSRLARTVAASGQDNAKKAISAMYVIMNKTETLGNMIDALNKDITEIDSIVAVVSDIADQTSLLSLNAAIEAARAGELGRGFAVVADEVQKLANRTISATKEIADKISIVKNKSIETTTAVKVSIDEVHSAKEDIDILGSNLESIVNSINSVEEQMTMIAAAVEEESQVSSEVVKNIEEILKLANDTSNSSGEMTKWVKHMSSGIDALRSIIGKLRSGTIFDVAQIDHLVWLRKIELACEGKLDIAHLELSDGHHCGIGKWYYSDGMQYFSNNEKFVALEQPHLEVHRMGNEVLAVLQKGDFDKAKELYLGLSDKANEVLSLLETIKQDFIK